MKSLFAILPALLTVATTVLAETPTAPPPVSIKFQCVHEGKTVSVELKAYPSSTDPIWNMSGTFSISAPEPRVVDVKANYFAGRESRIPVLVWSGVAIRQKSDWCTRDLGCETVVKALTSNSPELKVDEIGFRNLTWKCAPSEIVK